MVCVAAPRSVLTSARRRENASAAWWPQSAPGKCRLLSSMAVATARHTNKPLQGLQLQRTAHVHVPRTRPPTRAGQLGPVTTRRQHQSVSQSVSQSVLLQHYARTALMVGGPALPSCCCSNTNTQPAEPSNTHTRMCTRHVRTHARHVHQQLWLLRPPWPRPRCRRRRGAGPHQRPAAPRAPPRRRSACRRQTGAQAGSPAVFGVCVCVCVVVCCCFRVLVCVCVCSALWGLQGCQPVRGQPAVVVGRARAHRHRCTSSPAAPPLPASQRTRVRVCAHTRARARGPLTGLMTTQPSWRMVACGADASASTTACGSGYSCSAWQRGSVVRRAAGRVACRRRVGRAGELAVVPASACPRTPHAQCTGCTHTRTRALRHTHTHTCTHTHTHTHTDTHLLVRPVHGLHPQWQRAQAGLLQQRERELAEQLVRRVVLGCGRGACGEEARVMAAAGRHGRAD
jgi:hypothetical protein